MPVQHRVQRRKTDILLHVAPIWWWKVVVDQLSRFFLFRGSCPVLTVSPLNLSLSALPSLTILLHFYCFFSHSLHLSNPWSQREGTHTISCCKSNSPPGKVSNNTSTFTKKGHLYHELQDSYRLVHACHPKNTQRHTV